MKLTGILQNFCSSKVQALPPQYQEQREKDAIKNDPRLIDRLGNAQILDIKKVDGGYIVLTDSQELRVDVEYIRSDKPICGPAQFELHFNDPTPRQ